MLPLSLLVSVIAVPGVSRPTPALHDESHNPPARGAYEVASEFYPVPTLDPTDARVWAVWPVSNTSGEAFPMVSYNHGAGAGGMAILGYTALFEQIASYGVIVIATLSCSLGCSGGQWYGEAYAAEQRKVIEWAQAMAANPPADMPWAATLDFRNGSGIAGHSMGGESTGINARREFAGPLGIRAAVLHQAAILGAAEGALISIPSQHMTGTGDSGSPPGGIGRQIIYDAAPGPKAFRNQQGQGHMEPVLFGPATNPALGPFLAHWMRVYLQGDTGESYEMLFGDGRSSFCRYAEMEHCELRSNRTS